MKTKTKWTLFASAATMAASIASRKALTSKWSEPGNPAPPEDPELEQTSLPKALAWSLAVAGTAGVARLLALRTAAGVWRRVTSEAPPSKA